MEIRKLQAACGFNVLISMTTLRCWSFLFWIWQMCVAGRCAGYPAATDEDWYTEIFRGKGFDSSTTSRCSEDDIRIATLLLGQFVKAHASVLSRRKPAINPFDLLHGDGNEVPERENMLRGTLTQLQANNTVKVPSVKRKTDEVSPFTWQVMKVRLIGKNTRKEYSRLI
jgi:hypothetical protein